jgi:hypothetical protein
MYKNVGIVVSGMQVVTQNTETEDACLAAVCQPQLNPEPVKDE